MAGYMVAGAEPGVKSLVPVLSSNSEKGYTVSLQNATSPDLYPAYHAFDGNFPNGNNTMSDDITYVLGNTSGLQVFVELPVAKKLISVLPIFSNIGSSYSWSPEVSVYASSDGSEYNKIFGSTLNGCLAAQKEESALPYKFYRIDFLVGGGQAGTCLTQLFLFGK